MQVQCNLILEGNVSLISYFLGIENSSVTKLGTFMAILVTLLPFTHYGDQNGPSLEPWLKQQFANNIYLTFFWVKITVRDSTTMQAVTNWSSVLTINFVHFTLLPY